MSVALLGKLEHFQMTGLRRTFRSPRAGVTHHPQTDVELRVRTGQVSIECALKRQTVCVCAATLVISPSNALQAVLADRTCGGSHLARLLLDDPVIVWRKPDAKNGSTRVS